MNYIDQYQVDALRTAKRMPGAGANLVHAVIGIASEIAELRTSRDTENLAEEVGDVHWYLALAGHALGVKMSQFVTLDQPAFVSAPTSVLALGQLAGISKRLWVYERDLDETQLEEAVTALSKIADYVRWNIPSKTNLAAVLGENIAKLRRRFPDAYTNDAAEARADKGGLGPEVS